MSLLLLLPAVVGFGLRRPARPLTSRPSSSTTNRQPNRQTNRQWLVNAIQTTDAEILRSSGLDALVMIKSLAIGVQIFAPMALVGVAVLVPLHYRAAERRGGLAGAAGDGLDRSALMRLTIASLPQGSGLAW